MKKLILLILSLQCSLYNISLAQQPGDLDNSFNATGLISTPYTPWLDIAVQPDGKLLAVGKLIARYNIDGTLDGTFGTNGIDTIKINDTVYKCNAICIQQDGKILVAGTPYQGSVDLQDILLIRYNSNGSIDSSFDGDGIVLTDFDAGSDDHGYKLAVQADGKIIVAGSANMALALSRYHASGSLDSTFDNDGKLVVNGVNVIVNNYWHEAGYMKLQTNGKILVGTVGQLVRLDTDGSFDSSFGTNGIVTLSHGMNDLAIQPDGKIVLAGSGTNNVAITRFETNGNYDSTFGDNGNVTIFHMPGSPRQTATSVTLQPDGRILAGGYWRYGALSDGRDFVLTRFNQNGSLDSGFGLNAQIVTSFPGFDGETESHASLITPDLKVVLGGHHSYSLSNDRGFLARYHLGDMLNVKNVVANNEHFVISPNPTSDRVNIYASDVENGQWHFELRDITGRLILQENIVATGRAINKSISLHYLPEGIYLLELDNGKERTVSRVVKYR